MSLVTGAAGIIGRHVAHELGNAGADTRALVPLVAAVATEQFNRAQIVSGEIVHHDVLTRALHDVRALVVLSPAHPTARARRHTHADHTRGDRTGGDHTA